MRSVASLRGERLLAERDFGIYLSAESSFECSSVSTETELEYFDSTIPVPVPPTLHCKNTRLPPPPNNLGAPDPPIELR